MAKPGIEGRGLWTHVFERILSGELRREHIIKMVEDAKALHFNMFLYCVKAPGILFYPSQVGPSHPFCTQEFDPLAALIEESHAAGIEVHFYFPLFLDGEYDVQQGKRVAGGKLAQHPEWAVVGHDGPRADFACAAHEGYREYLYQLTQEQLANYDLDGIHMDFVRYPGTPCFCPLCVRNVKERYGIDISGRPHLARELLPEGFELDSLIDYYCGNVHETVVAISGIVKAAGKKLSAAVFPNRRAAIAIIYQDWAGFAPYLDFVCPMMYWYSPDYLRQSVAHIKAIWPAKPYLYPGFAASGFTPKPYVGNHNYWQEKPSMGYLAQLVRAAREGGADGFCILEYESLVGVWPLPYSRELWGSQPAGDIADLRAELGQLTTPPHRC